MMITPLYIFGHLNVCTFYIFTFYIETDGGQVIWGEREVKILAEQDVPTISKASCSAVHMHCTLYIVHNISNIIIL